MSINIQVVVVGPGCMHVDVFSNVTFLGATGPLNRTDTTVSPKEKGFFFFFKCRFRETLRTCKMDRARVRQQRRAVNGNNNNNNNTNNGDGGGGHVQGSLLSSVDSIDLFTSE